MLWGYSWIDVLFAAVLLICAVSGLIKGFVKSFISFFLVIAAAIVGKIFTPDVAFLLKTKTGIFSSIASFISEKISVVFSGTLTAGDVTGSAGVVNIPERLMKLLGSFIDNTNNTIGSSAEAFAQNAAEFIVKLIAFIAIFLAVILIGNLIMLLLDKLAELPVVKTFNRIGGLLLGVVEGCLILIVIATLIYGLNVFMQIDSLAQAINSSYLIKYFYMSFIFK